MSDPYPEPSQSRTRSGWSVARGATPSVVPAAMPDMLKTHDVLRWEYTPSLGRTIEQAIGASEDRLEWMRGARSDYEIALPLHELASFAAGTGYYEGLPVALRLAQLDRLA